ncbi:hypothetical protein GTS_53970 [Gandjariella thermophila]|uniref:Uncharacterized protein n=1 Tax=Gandjariella thermophila TaxID=1931992 RepID=A0A4D4JDQ8_9PSEU|nr:hypothetical protein GTS_53970 [Gandjariella thermophila]
MLSTRTAASSARVATVQARSVCLSGTAGTEVGPRSAPAVAVRTVTLVDPDEASGAAVDPVVRPDG